MRIRRLAALLLLVLAAPVCAGTWGVGNFDNDQAVDQASNWAEAGTAAGIKQALQAVDNESYIERTVAENALVAAEVVAASLGKQSPDLPDDLRDWSRNQPQADLQAMSSLARAALKHIRDPERSELYELWDEQGVEQWLPTLVDLESRLEADAPVLP